jgi:hypothetical protein
MKNFILLLFLLTTSFYVSAQSTETSPAFASLRQLIVDDVNETYQLEQGLSAYFNLSVGKIYNDPEFKQKLIDEFMEDVKLAGYKLPKKVKKDYFEPYLFLLDLEIYFDKKRNIVPLNSLVKV